MAGSIYKWTVEPGSNASIDPDINWMENQWPDTVNDSARQMMGRIAEWRSDITGALSAAGTADARTIATPNARFDSLGNGRLITFRSTLANTGTTTLNVNGLGAKAIRKMGASGDVDLTAGDLLVGGVYVAIYSTTANANAGGWLLIAPYTNVFPTLTVTTATIGSTTQVGTYGAYTGAPISSVVPGTTAGALIEGASTGHLVLAIRDNDANDSVSIVSRNGGADYSKLVAAFRGNGAAVLDAVTASTLTVSGTATFNGAVSLNAGATLGGNKIDAFPAGTRMLFQQTAAPTGWTKDTTHNNKALRLVSGTVATGGSVAFTTAFSTATATTAVAQSGTVGGTALTIAQLPSHTHGAGTLTGVAASAGAHTHGPGTLAGVTNVAGNHTHPNLGNGYLFNTSGSSTSTTGGNNTGIGSIPAAGAHSHTVDVNSGATASAGAHTHSVDVNAGATAAVGSGGNHTHTFAGDSHSHTTNLAVLYVDVIVCEKAA